MDKISTSRDLQASHGHTNERSLTKLRGSEPGDAQEQASPVAMPQAAKEIYRVPPGDWWIINLLLNWFFFFFTATPRPSPDQPPRDGPERQANPERQASPQPTPGSGTTMYFGNGNTNSGNITGSYNTTNNSTTTNNNNNTVNNSGKYTFGGGVSNTLSRFTINESPASDL